MQTIIFTDTLGVIPKDFYPVPSSKIIPEWYKDMDSYIGGIKKPGINAKTRATIKKCMPVFDAMVSGYTIVTHTDMYISQQEIKYFDKKIFNETGENVLISKEESDKLPKTAPSYETPLLNSLDFHPIEQAPNHPNKNGHNVSYPKWINPWSVKTPSGYSCLFLPPMHKENVFNILPGVVDTDKYVAPVNFPFTLNNPLYEGLVPAGTPIAQVVPFKREEWHMSIGDQENSKDIQRARFLTINKFYDSYKKQFRQEKNYH